MIDAVLFDLDGTLIDSGPVLARVLDDIRAAGGHGPVPVDRVRAWSALGVETLVARTVPGAGDPPAADAVADFRSRYSAVVTPPESLVAGARRTLLDLAGRGVLLGLVSNKPERLCRAILADLELEWLFATVVGGDTTPVGKPDPLPVHRALADLGVGAAAAVFVGDTAIDQVAATAAGVTFVWYTGLHPAPVVPRPVHAVADYSDFIPRLNRMAGRLRSSGRTWAGVRARDGALL